MADLEAERKAIQEKLDFISAELKKSFNALDQAHAALRDIGYEHDQFADGKYTPDTVYRQLAVISKWFEDAKICSHPGCSFVGEYHCESCPESAAFCDQHGSRGSDKHGGSVPGTCWKCGGFNADE